MQSYPHPEAAELVKLLPPKKHGKKQEAKFYRLAIWPDLFGGVSLVREYGYMGLEGQFTVEAFPELDAARHVFTSIVKKQQGRGYVPCEQRFAD